MKSAHSGGKTGKTGSVCRHHSPGTLGNVFKPMNGQNGGNRVTKGSTGGGMKKGRKGGRKKMGY